MWWRRLLVVVLLIFAEVGEEQNPWKRKQTTVRLSLWPPRHTCMPITLFFSRIREIRVRYASRGEVDGALFGMYISTVHLTYGFRAKRASASRRRATPPVHLRSGILSISTFGLAYMCAMICAYVRNVALWPPGPADSRNGAPDGLPVREISRGRALRTPPPPSAVFPSA